MLESRRSMLTRSGAAIFAGAIGSWMAGCDRSSGARRSVVAYISADDVLARDVLRACAAATGVEVDAVFDTEMTKTTALESRIRAERDRPRADLFWSSEAMAVHRLASEGLLEQMPEQTWSSWPEAHRDPQRRWLAFSARARVIVARKSVAPIDQWADLARPALAVGSSSSIAIADPRFGTTNGHFAALAQAWRAAAARGIDAPDFDRWLDGMRANGVRVLSGGNSATVEAVATGECAYGLTDSDDALAAIERGLPLVMSLARTLAPGVRGGGTMLIPNTVALIAGGPGDRAAAIRVAEFLVSPACEELIARSPSHNLPLGRASSTSTTLASWLPPFAEPDPLLFDALAASKSAVALSIAAKRRLEGASA